MLREQGAYPVQRSGRWTAGTPALYHVMDGYFRRSRPFATKASDFRAGLNFFLSNEAGYSRAIDSIEGQGGAFIGVGRCVPLAYAGWQRAGHAYIIDKKGMIPMGFVPVYGALLCMAKNRAYLISMMLGRPIQPESALNDEPPEKICEAISSRPFDARFAASTVSALTTAVAGSLNVFNASTLKAALREWMFRLGKSFMQRRRWGVEEECPASILMNRNKRGRGGVLASEQAFRQERELFLQGRVTGVAQDMIDGGLEGIVADMGKRGLALRSAYISNVEDVLLFNYLYDERAPDEPTRRSRVQRYYDFYRRLAALPDAESAFVISAKKRRLTSVDRLARYVRRSIPLDLPVAAATNAAKDFYRFRVDVAQFSVLPFAERLDRLIRANRTRQRFNVALGEAKEMFEGRPIDREALKSRIEERFISSGLGAMGWWLDMFLGNLEELGVVTGPINPS